MEKPPTHNAAQLVGGRVRGKSAERISISLPKSIA
jgi:hypothetical protein